MTTAPASRPRRLSAFVLAPALATAGVIHGLLTPEHMAMSALFGAGFLAAAIAQLGMATLAFVRPGRLLYAAVIASTIVLSGTYFYNVVVGLPFHERVAARTADDQVHDEPDDHETPGHADAGHEVEAAGTTDHHDEGVALGAGEPIDAYGAVTQLAQLSAAGVALVLLRRAGRNA